MSTRAESREYLRQQYSDDDKLRIRIQTHERYAERRGFREWVVDHVAPQFGLRLLDVGAATGADYHPLLPGVDVVSLDLSFGMLTRNTGRRVQADAQALPFADASFARVMANHMLYHARDKQRALREMRRVLRIGGRVVLTTNAADYMRGLHELHDGARAELGLEPSDSTSFDFNSSHLDLVRTVFPDARAQDWHNALVFTSSEPVLDYLATLSSYEGDLRERVLEGVRARVDEIIAREGVFRVPTNAVCFVADV